MVQVWGSGWNVGLSAICFALTSRVGVKPCAAFTYQRIDPDMTKAPAFCEGFRLGTFVPRCHDDVPVDLCQLSGSVCRQVCGFGFEEVACVELETVLRSAEHDLARRDLAGGDPLLKG